MTRRLKVMLFLLAGLAAAVGFDRSWLIPSPGTAVLEKPLAAVDPAQMSQSPLNPIAGLAPEILAPIFDRPLFRPTRLQPLLETQENTEPFVEPEPLPPAPEAPPKLSGTVDLPKPGGAFLTNGSGETTFVAVGQRFGQWKLLSVGDGWAEVNGPDGRLRLAFPLLQKSAPQASTP